MKKRTKTQRTVSLSSDFWWRNASKTHFREQVNHRFCSKWLTALIISSTETISGSPAALKCVFSFSGGISSSKVQDSCHHNSLAPEWNSLTKWPVFDDGRRKSPSCRDRIQPSSLSAGKSGDMKNDGVHREMMNDWFEHRTLTQDTRIHCWPHIFRLSWHFPLDKQTHSVVSHSLVWFGQHNYLRKL